MKIRFIRPLPQPDQRHVYHPGQILDAPEGFAQKMIRLRYAEPAAPAPVPEKPVRPAAGDPMLEALNLAMQEAHAAAARAEEPDEELPEAAPEETDSDEAGPEPAAEPAPEKPKRKSGRTR